MHVRRAMAYSVDKAGLVKALFAGHARAANAMPPPAEWAGWLPASEVERLYAKVPRYAFDLDKARALLKQANVTNLTLDMVLITSPESTPLVQIYQADLASIGVTMNIVNMDLAPWLDNVNNRKYHGMYYSPASIAASVGTELTTSKVWQVGNNNSGFDSPAYQQLATAASTETDADKLKQIYKQVNDLMLVENFR